MEEDNPVKQFYFRNAVLDLGKAEVENGMWMLSEQGRAMMQELEKGFGTYDPAQVRFTAFVPELYLLSAAERKGEGSSVGLGIAGLGAGEGEQTLLLIDLVPGAAVQALHCDAVLIGSHEERQEKLSILSHGGVSNQVAIAALARMFNEEILRAQKNGLHVVYCLGETKEELNDWKAVLGQLLSIGLAGADLNKVTIAYEPLWGKKMEEPFLDVVRTEVIVRFLRSEAEGVPVVYGGKLNQKLASALATIQEIDGIYFAPGGMIKDNLSIVQAYLLPERCSDCIFLR